MSYVSAIVKPDCALASMASSLAKEGGSSLRFECAKTEALLILIIGIICISTFWAFNFPKWVRLLPVWIAGGYTLVWIPLRTRLDNASEAAFMASGLTKTEWLSTISADQRTRLTVFASLTAALIVSLNAWITRWENTNNAALAAQANAQKGLPNTTQQTQTNSAR
jgi:hypothetical protein